MSATPHIELEWIWRWAVYAPQKVALRSIETGEQLTYRELYRLVEQMAAVLLYLMASTMGFYSIITAT